MILETIPLLLLYEGSIVLARLLGHATPSGEPGPTPSSVG
jgi:Sec-independent protein secretion pathway component TatC